MSMKPIILGLAAVLSLAAAPAFAGQCPADKVQANVTGPGATAPKAVTDKVLAEIDLAQESIAAEGRLLRLRELVIQPGGEVPWHSHDDRPAIIYVVEGEILEFSSNCAVPIVHKAGEAAVEVHGTSHWWKNNTNRSVVLHSTDILHDQSDKSM
jgi:quercetin dioxygenase-like cupin family protein